MRSHSRSRFDPSVVHQRKTANPSQNKTPREWSNVIPVAWHDTEGSQFRSFIFQEHSTVNLSNKKRPRGQSKILQNYNQQSLFRQERIINSCFVHAWHCRMSTNLPPQEKSCFLFHFLHG